MSDDSKNWQTKPDDIDLLALLERSILFFRRNVWIFLICILLGLLLGLLKYSSLPKIYTSRIILSSSLVSAQNIVQASSPILSNQNCIQIAGTWNSLLKSGNHSALAAIFNIPDSDLHKIRQIKAEEIQKIFTQNNPNGFIITAWVTDNSVLDNLQRGILHGYDNCDHARDRLEVKRNKLQDLIEKTSSEINRLDSIKTATENIILGKVANSSSLIIDGANFSRQLIDMHEKLLNLKEELKFTTAVQVLQGFIKFTGPAGPNLYKWLLLGLACGLSIAFFVTMFLSVNRKLKTSRRQQELV